MAGSGTSKKHKVMAIAIWMVIILLIPAVVFLTAFAPQIMTLIAGPVCDSAAMLMRLLAWGILCISIAVLIIIGHKASQTSDDGENDGACRSLSLRTYFAGMEWLKILAAAVLAATAALICRLDIAPVKSLAISAGILFIVYIVILAVCKEKALCECIDVIRHQSCFSAENIDKTLLITYGIYIAFTVSANSTLVIGNETIWSLVTVIRLTALAAAIVIIALKYIKGVYSKKAIIIIAGVTLLMLIVTYASGQYDPIKYWIFIIAAYGTELRRIIKTSCISHIIPMAMIVLLSINETAGMKNLVVIHGERVRHYMGFTWATVGSNLWMYVTFMWLYWRKEKIRIWELLTFAAVTVFFYVQTVTRSAFAFSMLAIVLAAVLKIFPKLRDCKKVYKIIAIAVSIAFPIGIIVASFFGKSDSAIYQELNSLLSGRLELASMGYESYGLTLFGQKITWNEQIYNYVDSSYVQMLLNLGIVFTAVVIFYFVMLVIKAGKKKDTYLLAALCLVIMHSTFDPQLIMIEYDTFVMGLSYVLMESSKNIKSEGNPISIE